MADHNFSGTSSDTAVVDIPWMAAPTSNVQQKIAAILDR
jgi:hypothetical protein